MFKGKKNLNVYFYKNKENVGQIGNWNRLIELANGKYILMSHDDDWVNKKILKEAEKYLDKGSAFAFKMVTKDFRKKKAAITYV